MDLHSLKLELVRRILEIENPEAINRLFHTLRIEDSDFWDQFNQAQKDEIELALKQVENGDTESWDDLMKRI